MSLRRSESHVCSYSDCFLLNTDQKTLKELIADCKYGKREAQKALYKMHYSFSLGVCMRYTSSIEQAQEVMNDGFMKVFKHISNFDCNRSFEPWLRRILINCSIDNYQKEQKRVKDEDFEKGKNSECEDSILDTISYNEILDVIHELPPAYQKVFKLRAIEGYKHEEISKMLNISIGTSKSNFSRAKEKVRKYLDTYFDIGWKAQPVPSVR